MANKKWRDATPAEVAPILQDWIEGAGEAAVPGYILAELAEAGNFRDSQIAQEWHAAAECLQFWIVDHAIDATAVSDLASHVRRINDSGQADCPEFDSQLAARCWLSLYAVESLASKSDSDASRLNLAEQDIVQAINELWSDGQEWPTNDQIAERAGHSPRATKELTGPMWRHGLLDKGPGGNGFKVRT